jgi:hypothetical protein
MPLSGQEAIARAEASAASLSRHAAWVPALSDAVVDPAVWRVRLSEQPSGQTPHYFLVTLRRRQVATARMAIDADSGAIREARAIQAESGRLIEFVDPRSVALSLSAAAPAAIEPDPWWQPCRASTSMIDPFFVAVVSGRRFYIRVDGRVFEDVEVIGHG